MNRGMVVFGLAAALALAGCSSSDPQVAVTTTAPQASTTAVLPTALPVPTQPTTTLAPLVTAVPANSVELSASLKGVVVGVPADGDATAVVQAVFEYQAAFAEATSNPTQESEAALTSVAVQPALEIVQSQIRSYRELGRATVANEGRQASVTVAAESVQIDGDIASVAACTVDSYILVERATGTTQIVNDEVVLAGWLYKFSRTNGRWLLESLSEDRTAGSLCGTD